MTDIELKDGERVNQLFSSDAVILQNQEVFSYPWIASCSRFQNCPSEASDQTSRWKWGRGLLASTRTEAQIIGVEIQERSMDMATRSIAQWFEPSKCP